MRRAVRVVLLGPLFLALMACLVVAAPLLWFVGYLFDGGVEGDAFPFDMLADMFRDGADTIWNGRG